MQSELGVDKFLFSKCDISNEDDINLRGNDEDGRIFTGNSNFKCPIFSRDTDPQYQPLII